MEPVTFFVFASPEKLSIVQEREVLKSMDEFLENWKSHGVPVKARANIEYGHFLTVEILPGSVIPGGCSKDELYRKIMGLEKEFSISFLDRKFVYFWESENHKIIPKKLSDIKSFLSSFSTKEQLNFFDTTVTLKIKWELNPVRINESWLTVFT